MLPVDSAGRRLRPVDDEGDLTDLLDLVVVEFELHHPVDQLPDRHPSRGSRPRVKFQQPAASVTDEPLESSARAITFSDDVGLVSVGGEADDGEVGAGLGIAAEASLTAC